MVNASGSNRQLLFLFPALDLTLAPADVLGLDQLHRPIALEPPFFALPRPSCRSQRHRERRLRRAALAGHRADHRADRGVGMDVYLAQVSLAHLLARRTDDVQPVTAGHERSADGRIKDRAPAS